MAQRFLVKSFINDAKAIESDWPSSATINVSNDVDRYTTTYGGQPNDDVIAVTSCQLSGNRIFTLVVLDDQYAEGGG